VNVVWVLLAVVAVIVVIALVAMMRRGRSGASETASRERGRPSGSPPAKEARAKERPADVEAAAEPPREVKAPVPESGEPREAAPAVSHPAASRPAPVPSAEEVAEERPPAKPEPAEPVKPRLSEDEIRSRLQLQLADSERMLKELKEATTAQEEGAEPSPLVGSVQIIEEGLSEVRSLAERKEWSHAKDKGEALHAQLALMLQMARRGGSS
jgi:hypothetical protein